MNPVWDADEAVELLREWIRVDTCNPPGNEDRLAQRIAQFLEQWDIPARVEPLGGGRSNVSAVLPGAGGGRKLMFCGHLDTVAAWPPAAGVYPPHGAVMEAGRIYGRGAADMKSGLAAMLLAFVSLKRDGVRLDGDLVFLATAGEEVDSCGAQAWMARQGMRDISAVVIGEPTGCRVAAGHKGALWLRLAVRGRSAHASMPENGRNAVEALMDAAAWLRRGERQWRAADALLGITSMAFTRIAGGVQTNVVPDRCEMDIDIRFVPPWDGESLYGHLSARLAEWNLRREEIRAELSPLLIRNPVLTPEGDPLIRQALELCPDSDGAAGAVSYYTDGSVLQSGGMPPVLLYGPGEPGQAHRPDEWVYVEAYRKAIVFYRELAVRYLGHSGGAS